MDSINEKQEVGINIMMSSRASQLILILVKDKISFPPMASDVGDITYHPR